MTTTLHIQLQINDLSAFKTGYADNAETRKKAGVRGEAVRHVVGDESRVVIDLDFGSATEAEDFLGYLRENVWKDQPIITMPPQATLLEPVDQR